MKSLEKAKELLKNPEHFCRLFFKNDKGEPLKLTSYQAKMIKTIIFKLHKKNLVWASTRAGKSLAIAIGIILLGVFSPGEKIRIIAPTEDHTKIIMNYVIQHIFDSVEITNQLNFPAGMKRERLKQEMSKKRFTFKNNSEIMIISASIPQEGRSLIGTGGSCIVVDEAEKIPLNLVKTKIMRMLGDTPDYLIFFISNPHNRGYMYEKMKDSSWNKMTVDWKEAVKEGRLTREFVMERKAELSPQEFTIWYESKYPEQDENSLIKWSWIENSKREPENYTTKTRHIGSDIAGGGMDYTVIMSIDETDNGFYIIKNIQKHNEADTMVTAGRIINTITSFKADITKIDAIGIGKGVADRIAEQGHVCIPIKVGESPDREPFRFSNKKAEYYWRLRTLFEEGRIIIPPDLKYSDDLVNELSMMKFELTSSSKIKIIDPSKSPDFADALCYGVSDSGEKLSILEDKEGLIF